MANIFGFSNRSNEVENYSLLGNQDASTYDSFFEAFQDANRISEFDNEQAVKFTPFVLNQFSNEVYGTKDLTQSYNSPLDINLQTSFQEEFIPKLETKFNVSATELQKNYDIIGLYNNVKLDLPDILPSNFTKPNHPVFSTESIYNGTNGFKGGTWNEDEFTPSMHTAINREDILNYFDGPAKEFKLNTDWIEQSSAYSVTEDNDPEYTKSISKVLEDRPLLGTFGIEDEVKRKGPKSFVEVLTESIDPRRENLLMTSVLEIAGWNFGSRITGDIANKMLGNTVTKTAGKKLLGKAAVNVGSKFIPGAGLVLMGLQIIGGLVTGVAARKFGIWLSGDDKQRRDAREAILRLNAEDYKGEAEKNDLIDVVESWKRENKVEELRGYGDGISGFVTQALDMTLESVGYTVGISGASKTVQRSVSTALANKLNPSAMKIWKEATDDMNKILGGATDLTKEQKLAKRLLESGPFGINKKQADFILKQTAGMSAARKAEVLPQMIQFQINKNAARFMRSGDLMGKSIKALLAPGKALSTVVAGTSMLPTVTQRIIDNELQSAQLTADGKYDYDTSFRAIDSVTRDYLSTYVEVAIESFGTPISKIIAKNPALAKSFAPIVRGIRDTKAYKLGGKSKIAKGIKAWKEKDNGLWRKKMRLMAHLESNWSFNGLFEEIGEEYATMVVNAVLGLDTTARRQQGITYSENVINNILFPVKQPREFALIGASLAFMPLGAAAGATLTGQLTRDEYNQTNKILRKIIKAEGVVTVEDMNEIVKEVTGIGETIFNAKGEKTFLGKILGWFDAGNKDKANRIFGKSVSDFKEAVNQRTKIIMKDDKLKEEEAQSKAIRELSAESLLFGIVVKDRTERTYFERLIKDQRIHRARTQDGNSVYTFFETIIDGEVVTVGKAVFKTDAKGSEDLDFELTEGNYGTAISNVQGVTYEGSIETVEQFKRQLIQVADNKEFFDNNVKGNAKDIDMSKFKQINFLRRRIQELKDKNESTFELEKKLNAVIKQAASQLKIDIGLKRATVGGRLQNQRDLDKELEKHALLISDLLKENSKLNIKSIVDTQVTGDMLALTGRDNENKILDIGGFNQGNTIFIGGLAFIQAGEFGRTLDEEAREINIKSKYDNKINITTLTESAIQSFKDEIDEFINTEGQSFTDPEAPEDEEERKANLKARLAKAKRAKELLDNTNSFEIFVAISQALSGQGREAILDVLDLMSDKTRKEFNAAILSEYTGDVRIRASAFMSQEEQQEAETAVKVWRASGGKKLIEDFIGMDLPQTLIDMEQRISLAENEVKFRDKASGQTRTYVKENGVWRNVKYKRPLTGKKLIAELEKRLQAKRSDPTKQMSRGRRKKEQQRRAFYLRQFKDILNKREKIIEALTNRLSDPLVELSEEGRRVTEEFISILKNAERVNTFAGTPLLTELVSEVSRYYAQVQDITFSADNYTDTTQGELFDNLTNEANEENDESIFDQDHFASTAKSFINAIFISRYGSRNGSLIIHELRNSDWLADIVESRESFEAWLDSPDNADDNFFQTLLKDLSRKEFTNPITGKKQSASYDDMYEFWKMGQSLRLFAQYEMVTVKGKDGTKTQVIRLANEYNYRLKILSTAKSMLKIDSSAQKIAENFTDILNNPEPNEFGETQNERLYKLIQNVTHLDRYDIARLDEASGGLIIQVLKIDKPADMEVIDWLRRLFHGDQRLTEINAKKKVVNRTTGKVEEYDYKNIIELLEPLIQRSDFNLKTRFTDVNSKEKSALTGDSHLNLVIDEMLDILQEEEGFAYADRARGSMLFDGFKGNTPFTSIETSKLYGEDLELAFKTIFFDSLKLFSSQFVYIPMQRFSEKGKMAFIAQKYFGRERSVLRAAAFKAREKWLQYQKTEAGRAILGDPLAQVEAILERKRPSETITDPLTGQVSTKLNTELTDEEVMEIHFIIHSVEISYRMNGTHDDYVTGKGRQADINNVLARNSQIATDGIRYEKPLNVIMVDEIITEAFASEGMDGEMILFGDAPAEIAEDFGTNLISNDDGSVDIDPKTGKPIVTSFKAHISDTININNILRRILIKTNIIHNQAALEATKKHGKGQAALQQLVDYVNAYNKGKPYAEQIHAVSFPSGAKFFPGEKTDYKNNKEPKILKLEAGRNLIRSQGLQHNNDVSHTGRMMKQMNAHMSALNNEATITTPNGLKITYRNNGAKASALRNEVARSIIQERGDIDLLDLVSSVSPPGIQKAFSKEGGIENPNDIRHASFFLNMLLSTIRKLSIPRLPRTALQVVGGLDNAPDGYGPLTEGNYKRTARITANITFARYETTVNKNGNPFKNVDQAVKFIKENRQFFYDMFFVDENGYPTDEVMIHELDVAPNGDIIIPGEPIMATRVPSGSNASHSFGRLTNPTSESFAKANLIVTNEGIRLAKGEDLDGDKAFTTALSRSLFNVKGGRFARNKEGKIIEVNPKGIYNMVITFDGWQESKNKTEGAKSKLNRAFMLELAIWHTGEIAPSYELQNDIPKAAFDAELVNDLKESNDLDLTLNTPRGLANQAEMFAVRANAISIFAKTNAVFSWLMGTENLKDLGLNIQARQLVNTVTGTDYDVRISDSISFENYNSLKRALDLILNQALDDNKDIRLFFLNVNEYTNSIVPILMMMNITENDFPANNKDFRNSKAAEQIKKVFEFLQSEAMRDYVAMQKFLKDGIVSKSAAKKKDNEKRAIARFIEKHGEPLYLNIELLFDLSSQFKQAGDFLDASFTQPRDLSALISLIIQNNELNTGNSFMVDLFDDATAKQLYTDNPTVRMFLDTLNEYADQMDKTVFGKIYEAYELEYYEENENTGFNVLSGINEFTKFMNIGLQLDALKKLAESDKNVVNAIRTLTNKEISQMSLEEFIDAMNQSALSLVEGKGTEQVRRVRQDRTEDLSKALEVNDNGYLTLVLELRAQELDVSVSDLLEQSFDKLSTTSQVALMVHGLINYGLSTTNFTGSYLGFMTAKFSNKLNKAMQEAIDSNIKLLSFYTNIIDVLEKNSSLSQEELKIAKAFAETTHRRLTETSEELAIEGNNIDDSSFIPTVQTPQETTPDVRVPQETLPDVSAPVETAEETTTEEVIDDPLTVDDSVLTPTEDAEVGMENMLDVIKDNEVIPFNDEVAEEDVTKARPSLLELGDGDGILKARSESIEYTEGQKTGLLKINEFFKNPDQNMFLLAGYAGTGKTTIVENIVKHFKQKYGGEVVITAPTNKAKNVLLNKMINTFAQGAVKFLSVDKLVYKRSAEKFSDITSAPIGAKLVIVDEASMLNNAYMSEIIAQTEGTDIKVVFLGDSAQLPPVGNLKSTDRNAFSYAVSNRRNQPVEAPGGEGFTIFNSDNIDDTFELTEVRRQTAESTVLQLATAIRNKNQAIIPTESKNEVEVMSSTQELIQKYISLYKKLQESEENPSAVVLTFTNKDRNNFNSQIRNAIVPAGSEAVVDGEPMVGLGNNDNTELDNGQQFVIKNPQIIGSFKGMIKGHAGRDEEIIEAHFVMYEREVTTDDGKVVLQKRVGLFIPQTKAASIAPQSINYIFKNSSKEFQDWMVSVGMAQGLVTTKNGRINLSDDMEIFTLGYAMSGHKSQGSQWKHVFVNDIYARDQKSGNQWLYTAVTRTSDKLYVYGKQSSNYKVDRLDFNNISEAANSTVVNEGSGTPSFSVDSYILNLEGFVPIPRRPIVNQDILDQYSVSYDATPGTVETAIQYGIDINDTRIPWQDIFVKAAMIDNNEQFMSNNPAQTDSRKRIANKIKKNIARVKRSASKFNELPKELQVHLITNFNSMSKEILPAIKLLGKLQYKEAMDAISSLNTENYQDIILADLVAKHFAIQDSLEKAKNNIAPNVLLQTGRSEYGITEVDLFGYIVKSDIHRELEEVNLSVTDIYGTVAQQHRLLKDVEANGDMKLLGKVKKAIRLTNGVPTKFQLTNNTVKEEIEPTNELSFSLMSIISNEADFNLRGEPNAGTQKMQDDLIKASRASRSAIERGRINAKNAGRLIGLHDFIDEDGKVIKTNKKIRAYGEKVQKLLPYLIEYMFNPKVNLTRIPYIGDYDQDMTWLSPKEKSLLEGTFAEGYNFLPPDLYDRISADLLAGSKGAVIAKVEDWLNRNNLATLMATLEQERKTIAPHLPSIGKSLVNTFQKVLEDQYEILTTEGKLLGGDFIAHRENYVPHDNYKKRGDEKGAYNQKTLDEDAARSENARQFKTFLDAAVMGGLLPVNNGYVPTVDRYLTTTAHSLRTKLAALSFGSTLDNDMLPMMLFDDAGQMGMLTEESAQALINALEAGMKVIDPDFTFKTKRFQNAISRLSGMVSEIKPEKLGYKRIKTGFKNAQYAWVKEGTPAFIAKHVFYDKEMTDSKAFNKFFKAQLLFSQASKSASIFVSLFHPIALAESFIAMEGLTGIDNKGTILSKLIFRPFKTIKDLRMMYRKMVTDPNFTTDWQKAGLMFDVGNSPDIRYIEYNNFIDKVTNKLLGNPITAPFGAGFKFYGGLKKMTDRWMWEIGLPMMKYYAATNLYSLEAERALENDEELDVQKTKEAIAAYVNDAFGSQEWEQYIWANPKTRDWLQSLMFAPDWTLSALNISGVTHMTPINRALGSPTSEFHVRNRMERYWTGFAGIVLLALPNMLQALIYELAGAIDPDDEDHLNKENRWTWENEKGHRLDVDVTPIFRLMGKDNYGKTKERKIYMRWGKQAYEVFEGWLGGPQEAMKTAVGKSSVGVKVIMEQTLNMKTIGWETEWAESEFFESLLGVEGKFWDGRIAGVIKKFMPLSVQPIIDEMSTPGSGRPPSFFAPVRLGTSGAAARKEIASVIDIYARAGFEAKLKGFQKVEQMESLVEDILIAVEKNGYDADEIFRQALSSVRTKYYEDYFEALQKDDEKDAIRAAELLNRVRTSLPQFKNSMRERLGTQNVSFNLVHQKVLNDFYKGFRNNVSEGYGANSWAFPQQTNIFRTIRRKRML